MREGGIRRAYYPAMFAICKGRSSIKNGSLIRLIQRMDSERGPDRDHPGRAPSGVEVQPRPLPNPRYRSVHWLKKLRGQTRSRLWYCGEGEHTEGPKGPPCGSQAVRRMEKVCQVNLKSGGRKTDTSGDVRPGSIGMGVDSLSQVDRESAP